jgi:hypothetical protein
MTLTSPGWRAGRRVVGGAVDSVVDVGAVVEVVVDEVAGP